MLKTTKTIHAQICKRLLDTENVFYRSTIVDGIKGFFKQYDPDFGAHEIHITADYPQFNLIDKLAGIEFIQNYLIALYHENAFCLHFSAKDIHRLLCGYEEEYQELIFNIYEPVLTAAIGCVISATDAHRLNLTQTSLSVLNGILIGKTEPEIKSIVLKAFDTLKQMFSLSKSLKQYIDNSLPIITARITTAMQQQVLESVFITPKNTGKNPTIYFSFGERMDDEQYRQMIREIMQCRFLKDKIAIIKEQVHSLIDFEEVLLDAALTQKEVMRILQELSLPEIASLSKKYSYKPAVEAVELREQEQQLTTCLHNYLVALPREQQDLIAKAQKTIQNEP